MRFHGIQIGTTVLALFASSALSAGEAEPRAGGRLEVPDARTAFAPVAYAADWSRRAGTGAADAGAFTIADAGHPVATGQVAFRAAEGAVHATWRTTARRDWTGRGLFVAAEFAQADYAGGRLTADGREVALDGHGADPTLHYGAVTSLVLRAVQPTRRLSVTFARPVRIRFQDNRAWGVPTFTLRMELAGETLMTDDEASLACTIAAGVPLALPQTQETRIAPDADWVPMSVSADVRSGSPLDFSVLCGRREPSGTHGRVVRRGDHFEFASLSGVVQRFYGVNLCGDAVAPALADAARLADRLARVGYNAVRVHHHENALTGPDGRTLDAEKMKRFRGFVDACTARGLYVTTDLFVSRGPISFRAIGEDRDGSVETAEFKELVLLHEGAFSNYIAWARQFLGHVHPVTGRRLAEEPALAWICLVNEGNLGNNGLRWMRRHPVVAERWRRWLSERRAAEPGVWDAVPDGLPVHVSLEDDRSVHLAAFTVFLGDLERRFVARMKRFLREEMNCAALVTDMNAWRYPAVFQSVRAECLDFSDEHHYYDHPEFEGGPWRLPSRCGGANPFRAPGQGVPDLAVRRILGQPFVVSEFGYCAPSGYRSVGGLAFGALAARQGWSGVWRFAWSHGSSGVTTPETKPMDFFDLTGDPVSLASERAAVCLFLRGDLAPAAETRALRLDPERLRRPVVPAPTVSDKGRVAAWCARMGTALNENEEKRKLGPSDGGAVVVDSEKGTFAVATARTCGVFAEEGRQAAGVLDVELKGARATVWASSLDGRPLVESRRILVAHLTDALDAGTRFGDARHRLLRSWGAPPHLLRAGTARVTLALAGGGRRVHALAADGARRDEVPCTEDASGRLAFTADIGRDPRAATCFYEICRGE